MIEVCDLHKAFGSVKAVDGVSFRAADGQITRPARPNGAGKTPRADALHPMKPDAARCWWMATTPHRCPGRARRRRDAGFARPVKRLSSRENIRYFGRCTAWTRPDRPAHRGAGAGARDGQTSRPPHRGVLAGPGVKTAIARDLVTTPRNVILDETDQRPGRDGDRAMRRSCCSCGPKAAACCFQPHHAGVAALCDRIVHHRPRPGRGEGTPDELRAQTGEENLEEAFVKAIGSAEGLYE